MVLTEWGGGREAVEAERWEGRAVIGRARPITVYDAPGVGGLLVLAGGWLVGGLLVGGLWVGDGGWRVGVWWFGGNLLILGSVIFCL